jgi:hypothetical protein
MIVGSPLLHNLTLRRILKRNKNVSCVHDTMHDGDIGARDLVHCDVASMVAFTCGVGEEKKVAAVESRFHRTTVGMQ